jgi:hypothetical protein
MIERDTIKSVRMCVGLDIKYPLFKNVRMYIGLDIKYPLFLSDFNETCVFWTAFRNFANVSHKKQSCPGAFK